LRNTAQVVRFGQQIANYIASKANTTSEMNRGQENHFEEGQEARICKVSRCS